MRLDQMQPGMGCSITPGPPESREKAIGWMEPEAATLARSLADAAFDWGSVASPGVTGAHDARTAPPTGIDVKLAIDHAKGSHCAPTRRLYPGGDSGARPI